MKLIQPYPPKKKYPKSKAHSSYPHYPWSFHTCGHSVFSKHGSEKQEKKATNGPADMITACRTKQSWSRRGVLVERVLQFPLPFLCGFVFVLWTRLPDILWPYPLHIST